MPKFAYTALAPDGSSVTGVQSAETLAEVRTVLDERDLHLLEAKEKRSVLQYEITKEKVKKVELMHFSRQLAVFVRAGIPILDGLQAIGEESTSKVLRRVLEEIITDLTGGLPFADAAAAHPEAFPDFYISVLRSAELTGNLDEVLEQLAEYIERDIDARKKVTSALVYPAIVLVMAIVVVLVMTIFVLPRFEDFFASLDAELPLATRMLLGVTHFVGTWGWLVALILVVGTAGLLLYFRTPRGKRVRDRAVLQVPALGEVIRYAILERTCRVLASMVSAGVPLPEALRVTGEVTSNTVYREGVADVREAMIRGDGLARPLAETGLFPGAARQMFRVGEETGTLDAQLRTAAGYFDRELEYKLKRFTALFEPAIIVFMGVVVGFVAIAMVSAMYGVYNQVEL
jgi:type IV pilus assembly protein PilC